MSGDDYERGEAMERARDKSDAFEDRVEALLVRLEMYEPLGAPGHGVDCPCHQCAGFRLLWLDCKQLLDELRAGDE